jgi:hypothetical protein
MIIPNEFQTQQQTLVNYDFTDLLTNVGYISLYGLSDDADALSLIRQAVGSTDLVIASATGTDASTEVNLDYTFLASQLVKGDLFITETYSTDVNGASVCSAYTTVEIFHVDGGTSAETSIGTQQTTDTVTNPANQPANYYRTTCKFAVDKKFKKGDKLRVEATIVVSGANANSTGTLYADPANSAISGAVDQHGRAVQTSFIVLVPFSLGGKI